MKRGSPRRENLTHPPIVLLVEDDESSREMHATFLEMAGFWVLGARNGAEALINARQYHPHVVVTDLSMPVMDGWDLARALRENDRTAGIGIIAISGCVVAEDEDRRKDVDTILEKPCLPDDLLVAVRQVLARGRLARLRAGHQIAKAYRLRARSTELIQSLSKHQRRRK